MISTSARSSSSSPERRLPPFSARSSFGQAPGPGPTHPESSSRPGRTPSRRRRDASSDLPARVARPDALLGERLACTHSCHVVRKQGWRASAARVTLRARAGTRRRRARCATSRFPHASVSMEDGRLGTSMGCEQAHVFLGDGLFHPPTWRASRSRSSGDPDRHPRPRRAGGRRRGRRSQPCCSNCFATQDGRSACAARRRGAPRRPWRTPWQAPSPS